ncbi:MAG TPA: PDZ domain-containing protein, partial [Gemmatimonadales bacterium]|nr:PDZ domain-containing protein [Gemmatimonadales bacterium]
SALATFSSVVPAGLAAQDYDSGPVRVFTFGRPRIGIRVETKADAEKDKIGARVGSVTEGGPADKAGIKEGDIITRFNGVALGGAKSEDEDDTSGPGLKLVELAQKLDAGDTVDVEFRRGTESKKAKIVAADMGDFAMRRFDVETPMPRGTMRMPRMEIQPGPEGMRMFQGGPGDIRIFTNGRFEGGLELADLNADLGEYFGAKEGVLVLKAPADSGNPLKAGDVIVSIDGRPTKSEEQARRILRSYGEGETAKLEVLRKQKKMTLSYKPEREGEWKMRIPKPTRRPGAAPERT